MTHPKDSIEPASATVDHETEVPKISTHSPEARLDTLEVPEEYDRLDRLIRLERSRLTGKMLPGFETLQSCWSEDLRRAHGLRKLPRDIIEPIYRANPNDIAAVLERGATNRRIAKSSVSAAYMHSRRLAVFGSVLKLIRGNLNRDLDLGFVRITHPEWRFGLRENWHDPAPENHDSLDRLFSELRLSDFPGFYISFLSGIYDSRDRKIQLFWHGICGGIKLRVFGIASRLEEGLGDFVVQIDPVTDLLRQLAEILPNRIQEGTDVIWRLDNVRRMREPYHSVYLMWLNQLKLDNRLCLSGVKLTRDRGFVTNQPM